MSTDIDATKNRGSDTYSVDERTLCDASDDEGYKNGRPSSEVSEGDHDILESEDERERLLISQESKTGFFGKKGVKIGRRNAKNSSTDGIRRSKKVHNEESSALMYEMEEGIGGSSPSFSRHSSESDEQRLRTTTTQRKACASPAQVFRRLCIYLSIAVLFVVLLVSAYRLSGSKKTRPPPVMVSNGTSLFAPTTILISLDGFRADFLYRGLTPTLNKFVANGISPKYMMPSFPSVTFPNHYTMATGLYPEAHGVVGNSFWDPSLKKEFYYTDPDRSLQPFWWGGEPLWVTAERQEVPTAVHMWPGSEAHIANMDISYIDKYNGSEVLSRKVDRMLGLLDVPGPMDPSVKADEPRPQFIAAYVPNVDADGHKYGPNSTEIRATIQEVDAMLGSLLSGLESRNLTNIVNVVIVSDHGMATTDVTRLIQLEDLVNVEEIEHIDGWPLYGLRPKKMEDLERIHQDLLAKAKDNPNIEVYLKDKDMPEKYHFSNNERIAPLWIVPKTGWAIVTKDDFDVEKGKENGDVYHPRGLHGYNHEHPLMRAIFVARGPAFPHTPNSRMEPFQNIELYNIVCDSIGITPAPNNGTLRLPLKPVGLHDDPEASHNETPVDPVEASSYFTTATMTSFSSLIASASGLEDTFSSIHQEVTTTSSSPAPPPPSATPSSESFWEWLTHKADHIEEWVEDFLHNHTHNGAEKDGA
ncbi:Phosphodiest-domain-containing protein [Aaosphaeria arxii CBS 175.79]|uniref:Phosphodiest-domain-containing protein n=1 Tax=Aaosphaeria arxii CBS 175.79 TaxID=1450172 RepID=A0A6A5XJD9_9PLEO|nr:Phosphodiest-domain-containing protein [Aaosphaeria arxii CBS 175.79]KAF2013252.1 Phosphodiest-domain-containing protein [Aaosphaeria arxii CBS 175.79]